MKYLIKRFAAMLGYRIQGTRYVPRQLLDASLDRRLEFDDIICRRMCDVGPELRVVQVGAYDGVTRDPLHKYIDRFGWRVVLIEPQPRAAEALRKLYSANERVEVVQAAVDASSRKRVLFTIEGPNLPSWAGGLASFDRRTILKHSTQIPGLSGMVREEVVDCITFDELLRSRSADHLDLLQLDTEGIDGYILGIFPFETVRPCIVHFEIKHLSMSAREECLARLAKFGYKFAPSGEEDMLAILRW